MILLNPLFSQQVEEWQENAPGQQKTG